MQRTTDHDVPSPPIAQPKAQEILQKKRWKIL